MLHDGRNDDQGPAILSSLAEMFEKLMEAHKVFVNRDGDAIVICNACGREKKLKTSENTVKHYRPVRVKCACGNDFHILFEKRKYYRKSVKFLGYIRLQNEEELKERLIYIQDISQRGLRFRSNDEHGFAVGQILFIRFILEGKRKLPIEAKCVVRNFLGRYVGVELIDLPEFLRKEIGYFLMP